MRMLTILVAIAVSAMLFACGGGGGGATSQPEPGAGSGSGDDSGDGDSSGLGTSKLEMFARLWTVAGGIEQIGAVGREIYAFERRRTARDCVNATAQNDASVNGTPGASLSFVNCVLEPVAPIGPDGDNGSWFGPMNGSVDYALLQQAGSEDTYRITLPTLRRQPVAGSDLDPARFHQPLVAAHFLDASTYDVVVSAGQARNEADGPVTRDSTSVDLGAANQSLTVQFDNATYQVRAGAPLSFSLQSDQTVGLTSRFSITQAFVDDGTVVLQAENLAWRTEDTRYPSSGGGNLQLRDDSDSRFIFVINGDQTFTLRSSVREQGLQNYSWDDPDVQAAFSRAGR